MPQSTNNYDLLIEKLDQFIRKYYINSVIRGLLYSTGLILLLFLVVSLLEAQFYFSAVTRKMLWYGFLATSLVAIGGWVVLPLSRYFRLGNVISHEKAADIVGRHFTNVKDKLLNSPETWTYIVVKDYVDAGTVASLQDVLKQLDEDDDDRPLDLPDLLLVELSGVGTVVWRGELGRWAK